MVYKHTYKSISELVNYIHTHEIQEEVYKQIGKPSSLKVGGGFSGTYTYDEAEELLLHGWEEGTKKIKDKLAEVKVSNYKNKTKNIYSPVGYQCSVPRYLQGMPDSMVNKVNVQKKNKVITINKSFSYSCVVSENRILDESIKVLCLINKLESEGYRVKLNVIAVSKVPSEEEYNVIKICIKQSSQRLNIKQIAFPLVHPAMLRRIMFALLERYEECAKHKRFYNGYGTPINDKQYCEKGEYFIPATIEEAEINDIEKYRIN